MRMQKTVFVAVLLLNAVFVQAGQVVSDVIKEFRKLNTVTDLAKGGVIVIPDSNEYKLLAQKIQLKLKDIVKADYQISSALADNVSDGQVVIAIGNLMNNSVIERLYWNYYTYVDLEYPGESGFVIETIHQPLPILPANNAVVLGGSSFAAAQKAVDSFLGKFNSAADCRFAPVLDIQDFTGKSEDPKYYLKTRGIRGFTGIARLYHKTGDKKYMNEAIAILSEHCSMAKDNPDWVLFWGDEIDSFRAVQAWDFIQEHAGLSDEENLNYEQFFLDLINKLVDRTEIYGTIKPGPVLAWNHATIPLLGMYTSARYYKAHYGFNSLNPVIEQVTTYLNGQKQNYRVSCDSVNYLSFSLNFCLAYYNMTGEMEYYENGNARKIAELIFAQTDNTGYVGGTGDIQPHFSLDTDKPWSFMEWKLELPELYWFRNQSKAKPEMLRNPCHPQVKPQKPDYLEGCVAVNLDKGMYNHLENGGSFSMVAGVGLPIAKPNWPYEKTFDKLQFRSFTEAGGEYLLIDGLGTGNHGHQDTGAIICGTFEGVRFLDDSDKLIAKSNEHTMVTVVKNGESNLPVPPLAALNWKFNFENGAYANVAVKNYNGMLWNRHILWFKDKYFLVFDMLKAEESGRFNLGCFWKFVDRGNEKFDGNNLVCSGPVKGIDKIKDIPSKVFNLRGVDTGWLSNRIDTTAEYPTKRIHQVKTEKMKQGDIASFQNIFYLERDNSSYEPARISQSSMIVKSNGTDKLVVAGEGPKGFESDSDFIIIGIDELVSVNISKLTINNKTVLSSSSKISVSVNDGQIEIDSLKAGELEIALKNDKFTANYNEGVTKINFADKQFSDVVEIFISQIKPQEIGKLADAAEKTNWEPVWNAGKYLSEMDERDICFGDINDDGKNEIVAAIDKDIFCFSENGETLWKYTHDSRVISCRVQKGTSNGIKVVAGTNDAVLLGLSVGGNLIKSVKIDLKGSSKHGSKGSPWVTNLECYDINDDGADEIIAGMRSWNIYIFDKDFNPMWYNSMVLHGVCDIGFGKFKDGTNLLYVGDKYGGAHIFDIARDINKDESLRKTKTIIGDVYVTVLDINNDGIEDIISASNGGSMIACDASVYFGDRLRTNKKNYKQERWKYDNYGFGFTGVEIIDSKIPILAAASESGQLLFLRSSDGKKLYSSDLGSPITTLEKAGKFIIAGTALGDILQVDFKGNIVKRGKVANRVLKIKVDNGNIAVLGSKGLISNFAL